MAYFARPIEELKQTCVSECDSSYKDTSTFGAYYVAVVQARKNEREIFYTFCVLSFKANFINTAFDR